MPARLPPPDLPKNLIHGGHDHHDAKLKSYIVRKGSQGEGKSSSGHGSMTESPKRGPNRGVGEDLCLLYEPNRKRENSTRPPDNPSNACHYLDARMPLPLFVSTLFRLLLFPLLQFCLRLCSLSSRVDIPRADWFPLFRTRCYHQHHHHHHSNSPPLSCCPALDSEI